MNPRLNEEFEKLEKYTTKKMESIPKVLFNPSFNLISELLESSEVLINVPKYNITNHKVTLSKNDSGGFTIKIENILSNLPEPYNIEIIVANRVYPVSDLLISMRETTLTRNEHNEYLSGKIICTGQVRKLTNQINGKELYHRFIIPTGASKIDYYVKTVNYPSKEYR